MANVFSNIKGLDTNKYLKDGFNTYVLDSGKYMGEGGAPITFSLAQDWNPTTYGSWMQPFTSGTRRTGDDGQMEDYTELFKGPVSGAGSMTGMGTEGDVPNYWTALDSTLPSQSNPYSVRTGGQAEDTTSNLTWNPAQMNDFGYAPKWWNMMSDQGVLPAWNQVDKRFLDENPELKNALDVMRNAEKHNNPETNRGLFNLKDTWWNDEGMRMLLMSMASAGVASALAPAAGAAGGAGGAAGGASSGFAAADMAGLAQMGIDAGLSGGALSQFVAQGGASSLAGLGGAAGAGAGTLGELVGGAAGAGAEGLTIPSLSQITNMPWSSAIDTMRKAYNIYNLGTTAANWDSLSSQGRMGLLSNAVGTTSGIVNGPSFTGDIASTFGGALSDLSDEASTAEDYTTASDVSYYDDNAGATTTVDDALDAYNESDVVDNTPGAPNPGSSSGTESTIEGPPYDGTQAPAPVQNGPTNPVVPGTNNLTTAKDWLANTLNISKGAVDALGIGASTLLSLWQNSQNSSNANDLADKLAAYGAPSRARYEGSFAPGFTMANEPGYRDALDSTSDSLLRRLSATSGNPYGSPGGLIEANKAINSSLALPALYNYRNQNASTGGYGAFNTAAPGAMANASASDTSWLTTLAKGAGSILNQPTSGNDSLSDLLRAMKSSGLYSGLV